MKKARCCFPYSLNDQFLKIHQFCFTTCKLAPSNRWKFQNFLESAVFVLINVNLELENTNLNNCYG